MLQRDHLQAHTSLLYSLAIVKTKMGGHIWVKNCESGGAEFSFCLPEGGATDSTEESRRDSRTLQKHVPEALIAGENPVRVLLVDDSSKYSKGPVRKEGGNEKIYSVFSRRLNLAFYK
jgi:hypothetical protein